MDQKRGILGIKKRVGRNASVNVKIFFCESLTQRFVTQHKRTEAARDSAKTDLADLGNRLSQYSRVEIKKSPRAVEDYTYVVKNGDIYEQITKG